MINNDTKIFLTYQLGGEYLKNSGKYTSADVSVFNPFTKKEVFKVNKPSKTLERAEYEKATCQITLGKHFIHNALTRPEKPEGMSFGRWLRIPLGKVYQEWKRLSTKEKLEFHIKQYVMDMNGEDYSYEII